MKYKGFTLVEMLAVIAIIGILASMLTGALMMVNVKVKQAAIAVEIGNLSMALENYKAQYGEYPPDGTDTAATNRHVKKVFPRTSDTVPVTLNPSTALVFWLGGIVSDGRPIGFAANPTKPFDSSSSIPRKAPFYEFNPDQLSGYQFMAKSGGAPYVYFRSKVTNNVGKYGGKSFDGGAEYGKALPYKVKGGVWGSEKSYQIIHSGMDGVYSSGSNMTSTNVWRSSSDNSEKTGDLTEGDLDNITNFTQGTVGDMME